MGRSKYYAVRNGRNPGVYSCWPDCQAEVSGYSRAEFKKFATLDEAEDYLSNGPKSASPRQEAYTAGAKRSYGSVDDSADDYGGHDECFGKQHQNACSANVGQNSSTVGSVQPEVLYRLEFDGAARGNPGPAGAGAVIYVDANNDEVGSVCRGLGRATNNEAEYAALIKGLEAAASIGVKRITVRGDSNLVVNQMNRKWQVKSPGLLLLYQTAQALRSRFTEFSISHIYRESNTVADGLSNEGIDSGGWEGLRTAKGTINVDSTATGAPGGSVARASTPRQASIGFMVLQLNPQGNPPNKTLTGGSWAARRNGVFNSPVRLFPTRTSSSCESAARFETESAAELLSRTDSSGAYDGESVMLRGGMRDWHSSLPATAVDAAMEISYRMGIVGLTCAHNSGVVKAEGIGLLNSMQLSSERWGTGVWAGVPFNRLASNRRQVPARFIMERRPAGSTPAKLPLRAARLLLRSRVICRLL